VHITVHCKRANSSVEQCSLGVWSGSICNTSNSNSKSQGGIPASSRASEGSGSLSGSDDTAELGDIGGACMGDSDWGASSCAHCTHVIKAQPRREGGVLVWGYWIGGWGEGGGRGMRDEVLTKSPLINQNSLFWGRQWTRLECWRTKGKGGKGTALHIDK